MNLNERQKYKNLCIAENEIIFLFIHAGASL